MEYNVGDYVMFNLDNLKDSIKNRVIEYGKNTNYKIIKCDEDEHYYYINWMYDNQCVYHNYFYTKTELRRLKIQKIINGIQRR